MIAIGKYQTSLLISTKKQLIIFRREALHLIDKARLLQYNVQRLVLYISAVYWIVSGS